MQPRKQALDLPTAAVAVQSAAVALVGREQFDSALPQPIIQRIAVVGEVADHPSSASPTIALPYAESITPRQHWAGLLPRSPRRFLSVLGSTSHRSNSHCTSVSSILPMCV